MVFAVLAVLIIVVLNFFQKDVRNFFYFISSPIQKAFWRAGDRVSDFFEIIAEFKNLKEENESLKSELQKVLAENALLAELKKENETLRQALDVELQKDFKLIFAQVIGKDVSGDSLIIDKGLKDGIAENLPVINSQRILVGRISYNEVYDNFSKVQLISDKESSFDAKILDKEIYGVVNGKGNFKLFLDLIPQDIEINKGELLVTAAKAGIFPEGLLVGEVKEVKKSDIEPFQQIEIAPSFDIKELEHLFIISRPK